MDRLKRRRTHLQYRTRHRIRRREQHLEEYTEAHRATTRDRKRRRMDTFERVDGRMRVGWQTGLAQAHHYGISCTRKVIVRGRDGIRERVKDGSWVFSYVFWEGGCIGHGWGGFGRALKSDGAIFQLDSVIPLPAQRRTGDVGCISTDRNTVKTLRLTMGMQVASRVDALFRRVDGGGRRMNPKVQVQASGSASHTTNSLL